jgi:hypothetical protein
LVFVIDTDIDAQRMSVVVVVGKKQEKKFSDLLTLLTFHSQTHSSLLSDD